MQKTVNILGTKCKLTFAKYQNGTLYMGAEHNGEPFLDCTVNWEQNLQGYFPYDKVFAFPANNILVIKNYGENAGIVADLVNAGVIQTGAYLAGTNGTVEACTLTDKWYKIATTQIS